MADATVQFSCPPMAIHRAPDMGLFFQRTDAVATVKYQNTIEWTPRDVIQNLEFTISPVTIPPTITRPTGFLEWTVDACVGEGSDGGKCDCFDNWNLFAKPAPMCHICHGSGWLGNRVRVELPRERVAFRILWNEPPKLKPQLVTDQGWESWKLQLPEGASFALIAEAIDASTTLWLADGRVFKGSVTFPDVKIDNPLFAPVAEAVVTTGGQLIEVKGGDAT